ncbi:MAG: NAD-dependent epimerase/dehydratase family protein [Candidatus Thermoplasmatota archaeon]|nr:NAD-dependent epimerase/dehydratase family protein [Candidatus Thermoplasmatota archaeon]
MEMLNRKSKTYLVSGGEGFIGRNLVDTLVSQGHNIIVVDNNVTSYPRRNIANVKVIRTCISKVKIEEELDGIFHLASVAAPRLFKKQVFDVILPNTAGTLNMIEHAKLNSCRLLYASSSEVYGSCGAISQQKMSEKSFGYHQLLSDKSVYSTSKSMGEELIMHAKRESLDSCSMRIFNVYGPNMDTTLNGNGRVFPNFFNAIRKSRPINIDGDGSQTRSFLFIDDCVSAIIGLMQAKVELPTVVNIGSEESCTIHELADLIAKKMKLNYEVNYTIRLSGDPDWRLADCSLIEGLIGWSARTSLSDGISKIISSG